jgi:8-oxo-dGTP pyrophosphatase MutT (NUDIX family)
MNVNSKPFVPNGKKQVFHTIWLGNLPVDVTEDEIKSAMSPYGTIVKLAIKKVKYENKLTENWMAFLDYTSESEANLAVENAKKATIRDKPLVPQHKIIKFTPNAKPREDKSVVKTDKEIVILEKTLSDMSISPRSWTSKPYLDMKLKDCDTLAYRAASILPTITRNEKKYVLLGHEMGQSRQELVILGGKIEKEDKTNSMATAAREFDEETGCCLDRKTLMSQLKRKQKVCWIAYGKLALYFLEDEIPFDLPVQHMISTKKHEMDSLFWIDSETLRRAVFSGGKIVLYNQELHLSDFCRNVLRTVFGLKGLE